jgi:hypothetical protein
MKSVNRAKRQIFKSVGTSGQGVISFWAKKEERIDLPLIEYKELRFK